MEHTMMKLGRLVIEPLARRVGTAFAAYLVASGIPHDTAQQFMLALGVVAGLGFDIGISFLNRKAK